MTTTPRTDLFDTLPGWLDAPVEAFGAWLQSRNYAQSTKTVYLAMFSCFCAWLNERGRALGECTAGDIIAFLNSTNHGLPPSRIRRTTGQGRQRQQYVRLLERVFDHLGALGYQHANPARAAGLQKAGAGRDQPARFLGTDEFVAVTDMLEERQDVLNRTEEADRSWIEQRDLAMVAMMLGLGLKVGHLERMTLNCMPPEMDSIDLSRLSGCAHRPHVLDLARAPMLAWARMQRRRHPAEPESKVQLFEGARDAGYGRTSKTLRLHASSIHRRTERFLEAAGIGGDRASAQTLRNTYASLLIDSGATNDELTLYLGLRTLVTARRLRGAYAASRRSRASETERDQCDAATGRAPGRGLEETVDQTTGRDA